MFLFTFGFTGTAILGKALFIISFISYYPVGNPGIPCEDNLLILRKMPIEYE